MIEYKFLIPAGLVVCRPFWLFVAEIRGEEDNSFTTNIQLLKELLAIFKMTFPFRKCPPHKFYTKKSSMD